MEKLENVVRLMAKTGLFFANCDGQYAQPEKDFIEGFIDKNVADATIDSNANAHYKDICSLTGEKGKSEDKLFAFNKI